MSMTKIEKALRAFFAKHPNETFYAMAIDAGYLYLSSEEQLAARRTQYSERWAKKSAPVTRAQVEAIDEDERDDHFPTFDFQLRDGATFEAAVAAENEARAAKRAGGNPYASDDSDEVKALRWGTGNFAYGQVVSLELDDAYLAHYAKDVPAQATTAYAKKAAAIVAALEAEKAKLLKGVKLASAFRIYAAEHED
jgi:hypothetical protein